jgi:hypothetical protein
VDISLAEKLQNADSPVQVWIKYDFCVAETAPKVLEASSCKEESCPSTIKESYAIEVKAVEISKPRIISSAGEALKSVSPAILPATTITPQIKIPFKPVDIICKEWDAFLKDPKNDAFCTRSCTETDEARGVLLATIHFSNKGSIVVEQVINDRPIVHGNNTLYYLMECLKSTDNDLFNQINSLKAEKDFPKITSINWVHDYQCRSIKEWIEKCNSDLKLVFNMPMKQATINNDTLSLILERRIEAEENVIKSFVAVPRSLEVSSAEAASTSSSATTSGNVPAPSAPKPATSTVSVAPAAVAINTGAVVSKVVSPTVAASVGTSVGTVAPSRVPVPTVTPVPAIVVQIPIERKTVTYIEKFDLPFEIKSADSQTIVFSRVKTDSNNERLLLDEKYLKNLIAKKLKLRLRLIIQLKGDFISGENTKCLDGNFLRGVLPSGNDCEGGLFESWVSVEIPGVSEELQISPKVTEELSTAGKTVDEIVEKTRDTGLKIQDLQKFTPTELSSKLNIPEAAASEVISTVKTVEEFRELDETDYNSLTKIKAEGISLADVAKTSSAATLGTKIGVSETTASRLISKAKSITQEK